MWAIIWFTSGLKNEKTQLSKKLQIRDIPAREASVLVHSHSGGKVLKEEHQLLLSLQVLLRISYVLKQAKWEPSYVMLWFARWQDDISLPWLCKLICDYFLHKQVRHSCRSAKQQNSTCVLRNYYKQHKRQLERGKHWISKTDRLQVSLSLSTAQPSISGSPPKLSTLR
jgi:hypothetical protein